MKRYLCIIALFLSGCVAPLPPGDPSVYHPKQPISYPVPK